MFFWREALITSQIYISDYFHVKQDAMRAVPTHGIWEASQDNTLKST